ncbi:MAG: hypothetical protein V1777_03195 [Candidatus Micrarchaeota archaeon]
MARPAGFWVPTPKSGFGTVLLQVDYKGQCGCGSSKKFSRTIELDEYQTLDDLHYAILSELHWTDEHLYSFFLAPKPYSHNPELEFTRSKETAEQTGAKTADVPLKGLGLKKGQKFCYVYDFGDDHQFQINVIGFGKIQPKEKYPKLIKKNGESIKQYPDLEE